MYAHVCTYASIIDSLCGVFMFQPNVKVHNSSLDLLVDLVGATQRQHMVRLPTPKLDLKRIKGERWVDRLCLLVFLSNDC